jgi:hypothetical protein
MVAFLFMSGAKLEDEGEVTMSPEQIARLASNLSGLGAFLDGISPEN